MIVALSIWFATCLACTAWVVYDLRTNNPRIMSLMQWVWTLTTLYSGPLGLAVYYYSGRTQIARDSVWRRGFRSVAHCYSGCGAGEIIGLVISVGLFSLGNYGTAAVTFLLAYTFGYALTLGPLLQGGETFARAFKDTFYAETASIVVMEATAIGVDLWLGGGAGLGEPRFWSSLAISLSAGLFAAYPVNVALIHWGVKEGMMNPREMRAPA